jgi:hypothetical protein
LLRDIVSGDDPAVLATRDLIAAADADIILLLDIDHDAGLAALTALAELLEDAGSPYPHRIAPAPNTGRPTGVDLDGDGRTWRARDAQGFGYFTGDGGMALLSRYPIGTVRDFTALPWIALPGNAATDVTPPEALELLALHSVGAWDVEVLTPSGSFHVLASHASPPVFDGPEDRNGLRNADELRFWNLYLGGWAPEGAPFRGERFALMATLNLDPARGEGRRMALRAVLDNPRLQDPEPTRPGGGRETADWPDPVPGDLRVDYILPAAELSVAGAGVLWPDEAPMLGVSRDQAATASDHRLVWVDLDF